MAKKKEKFPYKFLSPNRLDELKSKSPADLQKLFLSLTREVKKKRKAKKEDHQIKDLTIDIKEAQTKDGKPADIKRLAELQEEIKDLRKKIDEDSGADELKEDKKALVSGYNELIKQDQEELDVIIMLLDKHG